ncbi:MAG: hypothetical protein RBS76_04770 [Acholeplasmatales bacterium]|jgi:hypothetical protein|nr:hypothetical protein [Acholeplasmataceae bacterium]MCK9428149.1 hypothetical protein [Acholeplasmataceae bacterium]MDD4090515.1 hypothetical protein [Acholeplasmataceae bacterium]MDY0115789.1 hypothetical protein [Acholeplasmatales bacterium]
MKKVRIIFIFITILFGIFTLTACAFDGSLIDHKINSIPKNNLIEFKKVVFEETFIEVGSELPMPVIVQSQEMLITFFSENDILWESDTDIWNSYDTDYFENKALVFYFFGVSGTQEPFYSIDFVQVIDGELKLFLTQHGSSVGRAYFKIIIAVEISKSYIVDVVSVNANIRIVEDVDMNEQLKIQIIQSAWSALFLDKHSSVTIDYVYIEQYYGTFNESVAVLLWLKDHSWFREVVDISIAEFEFRFNIGREIKVWRNGTFYGLQEAVDEGFLTLENIKIIHEKWSNEQ